jgi:hypothetical protein
VASRFVVAAMDELVAAGRLPAPREVLPTIGAPVEAIEVGGKPSPACRYGVGVVTALEWDGYFRAWRVDLKFDGPTGGWCGYPMLGTHAFPHAIHVIGSDERPISSMTPAEITELAEIRRQEFWRNIDPASGLTDPSGIVRPRQ